MIPLFLLATLFALPADTFGAPTDAVPVSGRAISLSRRSQSPRDVTEWGTLAKNQRDNLLAKYGGSTTAQKRSTGYNLCVQYYRTGKCVYSRQLFIRIVDQQYDSR
jgi:cathepsin D